MAGCLVGGIRAPVGKCGALSGARPGHLVPLVASEAVDRADKGPTVSTRWSYTRLNGTSASAPGGLISLRVGVGRRTSMWVERARSVLGPPGPIWPW